MHYYHLRHLSFPQFCFYIGVLVRRNHGFRQFFTFCLIIYWTCKIFCLNCGRVTWKAMKVIPSWSSSFRKFPPFLLLHKPPTDIGYINCYLCDLFELTYLLKVMNFLLVVRLYRFTSDVKLKSISIVGGTDGTSPAKMRVWDLRTNIYFIPVLFYKCFKFIMLQYGI